MPRALIPACLLSLVLLGCAKEKAGSPPPTSVPVISTADLATAQALAKAAEVKCADAECHPSVAMLSIAYPGAGSCTGTLVERDVILTNSHCIPEDLKRPGSSCRGRIYANFPVDRSQPQYEKQIGCDQVIFASSIQEKTANDPDYAYIRLASKSKRPALEIDRRGFRDQESVSINKVDPNFQNGDIRGSLRRATCEAVYGSEQGYRTSHPLADVMLFTGCELIQGNSGSALLGADGRIRGLIHTRVRIEEFLEDARNKKIFLTEGTLLPGGVGTNLACVGDPLQSTRLNPGCDQASRNRGVTTDEITSLVREQQEELLNRRVHKLGAPFNQIKWTGIPTSESTDELIYLRPHPRCVLAGTATNFSADGKGRLPRLASRLGINSRYAIRPSLRAMGEAEDDLHGSLQAEGDGSFAYEQDSAFFGRRSFLLKTCE